MSAIRINWDDKAAQLGEIARELNLGLDALVFMDDSPAECERIRRAYPEALVVELPREPHRYRGVLESLRCFEQLTVTAEDRGRAALYRTQAKRQGLLAQAGSLEEFYASLEMRGVLSCNDRTQIARLAQMTQKTNQFNLTTRRYTEADLARFMEEGWVYGLQVEDRFGDHGIIAAAIVLARGPGERVIDTFLMSCRVVMRTIEETLLAVIAQESREQGATALVGLYIPSEKNQMVRDFYDRRGFTVRSPSASGVTEYTLDVTTGALPRPSPWLGLRVPNRVPRELRCERHAASAKE